MKHQIMSYRAFMKGRLRTKNSVLLEMLDKRGFDNYNIFIIEEGSTPKRTVEEYAKDSPVLNKPMLIVYHQVSNLGEFREEGVEIFCKQLIIELKQEKDNG